MTGSLMDILAPAPSGVQTTAAGVTHGPLIPPQQQLLLYSPDPWEDFVHEWAHYCLKKRYVKVQRFSGAGDRGIDVAGFVDAQKLQGVWDNYQCKHYDHALMPSDVWAEFGKIIWYSFSKAYSVPRHYFFVAPKGAGTKLSTLLNDATRLKEEVIANWEKHIRTAITSTQEISLERELLAYVQAFNFSIFEAKTALQLTGDHRDTPVHAARFGGGLPPRPVGSPAPSTIAPGESKYVSHLLDAYADHTKAPVSDPSTLRTWPKLNGHFIRQREAFYQAEALRVFARDSVPAGTFEAFQDDIYDGVVDTHDANHADGYVRVCEVTKAARELQITANPLISCSNPKDRDGVCHQLANEDRLKWSN
ncbi:hypothetical protein J2W28_004454 [Variovorax boronicumulans]|uniref:ABC-three component system protein n=1 Tax=Variovorax boronicumulans TaxID=436515 RepID=UPI0027803FC5|nr:ABC-three component system protein [Variovorax boronicumulans]MDP9993844.1 hypothetical protein [Variovorax boronicumulans]MDQ0005292.1 hypothetical protein [Variovorax boronicumulans]